ncbi:MAG: DMT family transporter [Burkholderiales bacterium]|nr:DMT family transporter [Burkholderiales bacterium]
MWTNVNGDLLALCATLFWSAANVTIARGSVSGDGQAAENGAFLSILLTALLSGGLWLTFGASGVQLDTEGVLWFALAGFLSIFVGRVFLHSSIQWLGAMRGTSVKRLMPLFSVLLAVTLLGEPLSAVLVGGMALIFAGFGVLLRESLHAPVPAALARRGWLANPGLWYGTISALAYAAGNVARKWGLDVMPNALLGVAIGAVTGALLFLATATVVPSYRQAVHSTFTRFNPWLFATGVLASAGQILFFLAIDRSTVTRVSLIVSLEVFFTIGLTVGILGARERLTRAVVVAATLGFGGTLLILLDRTGR